MSIGRDLIRDICKPSGNRAASPIDGHGLIEALVAKDGESVVFTRSDPFCQIAIVVPRDLIEIVVRQLGGKL